MTALKKGHYVRIKSGGGTGRVEWVGRSGRRGGTTALVRWDLTDDLSLMNADYLKVLIKPVDDGRIEREPRTTSDRNEK